MTEASGQPAHLILRPHALRDGYSDNEIRRLRGGGVWTSVRRGAYLPVGAVELDPRARHRCLVDATLTGLRRTSALSPVSAAVLFGIPLWSTDLGTVHITREPPSSTGRSASLVCHVAALDPDDLLTLDGLTVTSPARTVVDLARTLPFEQAVVAADGALHSGLATSDDLAAALERMAGTPGMRNARLVVRFADGRAESVGESRSGVMMLLGRLPAPELQVAVRDESGDLVGRGDFGWQDGRVIGEFDGRVKYGRLLRPGESAGDAVFREKRREDAFRGLGRSVVRWVWDDLGCPALTVARIRHAIALGQRRG